MSKSVLLLGNGFNQCLKEYLKDDGNIKLEKYFEDIVNLWNKFSHLMENEELKNNLCNIFKVERINSVEEVIHYIYISMDFLRLVSKLSVIEGSKKGEECLSRLSDNIKQNIYSKLSELVIDFWKQEIDGFYSSLIKVKKNLRLENKIKEFADSIVNIYTTNYDGVADTIFNFNQGNEYLFKDYFCGKNKKENYVYFCPENIEYNDENKKLIHLHGSYKFFKFFIKEKKEEYIIKIKTKKYENIEETKINYPEEFIKKNELAPIIVLDAKIKKKEIIENNALLREYFRLFENDLKTAKNLIIWGSSLTNDSHIENAIEDYFLKKINWKTKKLS